MRIGVMLPNWVGDLAMATPTLRALRKRFPQDELVGVVQSNVAAVLEGLNWLDRTLIWDHRQLRSAGSWWNVWRELHARPVDTFVLLRNSWSSAVMAKLAAARRIVGYQRFGRGWLLTDTLAPPREGKRLLPISAVDYYLNLAYHLGCEPESPRLELATLPADEAAADAVCTRLHLPAADRVVLLSTGGAYGSSKQWPVENAAIFSTRVAEELGLTVLVLCGPGDRAAAEEVEQRASHPRVKSLAREQLSLGLSKALIRRARLLVATDSGPRHLAAALGTATVSLFGSTDPRWAENYQTGSVQLRLGLHCSPCAKRECPLGHHRCMKDLSPDLVFRAAAQQLQCRDPARAA